MMYAMIAIALINGRSLVKIANYPGLPWVKKSRSKVLRTSGALTLAPGTRGEPVTYPGW